MPKTDINEPIIDTDDLQTKVKKALEGEEDATPKKEEIDENDIKDSVSKLTGAAVDTAFSFIKNQTSINRSIDKLSVKSTSGLNKVKKDTSNTHVINRTNEFI